MYQRYFKRIIDLALSACGIIVLAIPMLIIALAVKLDSKGPVLFWQKRIGIHKSTYPMPKFRSMYTNAEQDGPQWADKIDCRCTRVGRFIRKTRLDELPQLWNILKGDMSFVGPRPERAYFYDQFDAYIDGFRHRMAVQPGLTGLFDGGVNV